MLHTVSEPSRSIPVIAHPDVLVAGGGPAGAAAAWGAARAGASVLLVERHGFLGGMLTAGGVRNVRQYTDHRRLIIGGFAQAYANRLCAAGGSPRPPGDGPFFRQDPEISKFVLQSLLEEAGVRLLLHTLVVGATLAGEQLHAVLIENKSGRQAIQPRIAVDATGDGDLIARSGAAFEKADGCLQPMTLTFTAGGIAFWPNGFNSDARRRIEKALQMGTFPCPKRPGLFALERPGEYYFNATRVAGDATDAASLTRAELEARRQVMGLLEWLRRNIPGCENVFLIQSAPHIGLRETRRLKGLYTLCREDVLEGREFEDGIARNAYGIDIHNPDGPDGIMIHLEAGRSYTIPYRCLVPEKRDGLLAAGRCISASRDALGSTRVMAPCMAIGQAAGVAAASCARQNLQPRQIDAAALRRLLIEQGAIL